MRHDIRLWQHLDQVSVALAHGQQRPDSDAGEVKWHYVVVSPWQDHVRGKKHQRRMARAALEGGLPAHHMGISHSVGNTPPPPAPTPPLRPGVLP